MKNLDANSPVTSPSASPSPLFADTMNDLGINSPTPSPPPLADTTILNVDSRVGPPGTVIHREELINSELPTSSISQTQELLDVETPEGTGLLDFDPSATPHQLLFIVSPTVARDQILKPAAQFLLPDVRRMFWLDRSSGSEFLHLLAGSKENGQERSATSPIGNNFYVEPGVATRLPALREIFYQIAHLRPPSSAAENQVYGRTVDQRGEHHRQWTDLARPTSYIAPDPPLNLTEKMVVTSPLKQRVFLRGQDKLQRAVMWIWDKITKLPVDMRSKPPLPPPPTPLPPPQTHPCLPTPPASILQRWIASGPTIPRNRMQPVYFSMVFVNGIKITMADIYIDPQVVIHGLERLSVPQHLENILPMGSLRTILLNNAIYHLRNNLTDYGMLAQFLSEQSPFFTKITVFGFSDESIILGGNNDHTTVRFCVIRGLYSFTDLVSLQHGSVLQSCDGSEIIVTRAIVSACLFVSLNTHVI